MTTNEGTNATTRYGTALLTLRKIVSLFLLFDAYGKKEVLKMPHRAKAIVIEEMQYALKMPTASVLMNLLMSILSTPINAAAVVPGSAYWPYIIILFAHAISNN